MTPTLPTLPGVARDLGARGCPAPIGGNPRQPPTTNQHPGKGQGQGQPPWLAARVETSRRAAKPTPCPTCGAQTLLGPDHDTCALTARVDLTPVDRVTEVVALLTGRQSYDLAGANLHHREPEHVHADRHPHPIHLEHRCTTKETLW